DSCLVVSRPPSPRPRTTLMEPLDQPDISGAFTADSCHLRIPSRIGWIEPTVAHLVARATQCGAVRPARAGRVTLALHQGRTNAVIHGNLDVSSELKETGDHSFAQAIAAREADPAYSARVVDIQARYDGRTIAWTFTDQGKGFDHAQALRRLEEPPDPER